MPTTTPPATTTSSSAPARRGACSPIGSSADRRTRVLVLEAGGHDDWIWFHIPIGYVFSIGNPRSDWCYRTEPEPRLGGRSIPFPRGKAVGGSSAINGMIYMRGHAADFDQWRQLGLNGWGWDDVLPYFKAHEDFCDGADEAHGAGGELRVDPPRLDVPVLDAVRRAAIEAGVRPVDGFQPRRHGRRRAAARQPAARPALPGLEGVPAAGPDPTQPDAGDRRAGRAHPYRGQPRRGRRLSRQRRAHRGPTLGAR